LARVQARAIVAAAVDESEASEATLAPEAHVGQTPQPDSEPDARELVPERIGRYVVLRRLGAGAMGVVVIAYDPELDRQVAIKLIHPRVAKHGEARARMLREAKGLARLSHPNVVQIHDAGTVEGRVFIAMELVDGQPLSRWAEARREGPGSGRGEPKAAKERSPEQILSVYTEAGRGLAAAHDAGLVHRDFKPDNVLVDADGRARVLDFGLVRTTDDTEARERSGGHASATALIGVEPTLEVSLGQVHETGGLTALLSASELEVELTHGGQIMGTPAYMSPEQWKGAKADARSDQFSFCVALWEALYGERPFIGRTVHALANAMTSGTITEPSSSLRLPRRIRAALERGLAADPARRFDDMHALLRELERGDQDRGSLPLAAAAIVVFALLAWVVFSNPTKAESTMCADAGDRAATVWNEARREQVGKAFARTEVPSEKIVAKLGGQLDEYADRWRLAAEDNCAATHVREVQSEALLELRARCLDAKLGELDALLEVFAAADAATVDEALLAVENLPSLHACEAARVSQSEARMPEPILAARVSEARRQLARARASLDTGRFVEAGERFEPLRAEVEALGFAPLSAEFELESGRLHARIDRWDDATAELERGFFLATALRDDELALRAATWLAELEGVQRQRTELSMLWTEYARALLEREPGRFPNFEADLADTISWNAYMRGDYATAQAEAERGLALLDAAGLDAPMHRMELVLDRGAAEYSAGDLAAAEASFGAALELAVASVGRDNAKATSALNNLSITYSAGGDFVRARALLVEIIATRERALGRDNTSVGVALSNLADVELELGNIEAAHAAAERGYAILEASAGVDQYATVIARQRLGLARGLLGKYDDAIVDLREVLAIAEAPPEPDPSLALELRADLVVVLAAAGRARESTFELGQVIAAEPPRWRELVAAGRYAIALEQLVLAEQLLTLALERAGDPEDAGARRMRALAKLALAELFLNEGRAVTGMPDGPARAAAMLTGELEADLRSAPKLAAELAELRQKIAAAPTLTD
jgi:eukaryotic-like serine/threonine-protein kinase